MVAHRGFIPETIIEGILSRADIVEVISEYVPLKKSGGTFKGLCPFHSEKTPSFTVSAEKQFFYCFGCSVGGNVFQFLMRIENLSFPESVRSLASRFGVTIPETAREAGREPGDRDAIYALNQSASDFFEGHLRDPRAGTPAREYLEKRGINPDQAKCFSLGFAPDAWDSCLKYFENRRIPLPVLEKNGLIKSNDNRSKFFDRFRNRIIFPFRDTRGRVVGFGGRILRNDTNAPKYLNSPETSVFKKGRLLYGIFHTGQGIRKSGYAILTEGYFDFLTCYHHGIQNVVANSGTSLTEDHASLLKRYTDDVTIIYDADPAGKSATERGFDILLKKGLRVKVVTLPQGEDPDSYLRKFGKEAFQEMLERARPFIEHLIHSAAKDSGGSGSLERKMEHARHILSFINKVPGNIEKSEYITMLSDTLKISEKAIQADLRRYSGRERPARGNQDPSRTAFGPLAEQCERGMIQIIFHHPDRIASVQEAVSPSDFKNPDLARIASVLFRELSLKKRLAMDDILAGLSTETQRSMASSLAMERVEYDNLARVIQDFARGMKKEEKKNKLHEIQEKKTFAVKMLKTDEFRRLKESAAMIRQSLD